MIIMTLLCFDYYNPPFTRFANSLWSLKPCHMQNDAALSAAVKAPWRMNIWATYLTPPPSPTGREQWIVRKSHSPPSAKVGKKRRQVPMVGVTFNARSRKHVSPPSVPALVVLR